MTLENGAGPAPATEGQPGPGPDFMCVGAQKGGTQWLYDQLALHPGFWMPPIKELHHFDAPGSRAGHARSILDRALSDPEGDNRRRAEHRRRLLEERDLTFLRAFIALREGATIEDYADLFAGKGEEASGDITPGYAVLEPPAIAGIAERFPRLKVIFMARNPIDRFWSALNMRLRRGDLKGRADATAVRRFAAREGVMQRSRQSVAVRRWRQAVPSGSFALYFFDDLVADPASLRRDILAFLGASPDVSIPIDVGFNRKSDLRKVEMTRDIHAAIRGIFAEELEACAEDFGGHAVDWATKKV